MPPTSISEPPHRLLDHTHLNEALVFALPFLPHEAITSTLTLLSHATYATSLHILEVTECP